MTDLNLGHHATKQDTSRDGAMVNVATQRQERDVRRKEMHYMTNGESNTIESKFKLGFEAALSVYLAIPEQPAKKEVPQPGRANVKYFQVLLEKEFQNTKKGSKQPYMPYRG